MAQRFYQTPLGESFSAGIELILAGKGREASKVADAYLSRVEIETSRGRLAGDLALESILFGVAASSAAGKKEEAYRRLAIAERAGAGGEEVAFWKDTIERKPRYCARYPLMPETPACPYPAATATVASYALGLEEYIRAYESSLRLRGPRFKPDKSASAAMRMSAAQEYATGILFERYRQRREADSEKTHRETIAQRERSAARQRKEDEKARRQAAKLDKKFTEEREKQARERKKQREREQEKQLREWEKSQQPPRDYSGIISGIAKLALYGGLAAGAYFGWREGIVQEAGGHVAAATQKATSGIEAFFEAWTPEDQRGKNGIWSLSTYEIARKEGALALMASAMEQNSIAISCEPENIFGEEAFFASHTSAAIYTKLEQLARSHTIRAVTLSAPSNQLFIQLDERWYEVDGKDAELTCSMDIQDMHPATTAALAEALD